MSEKKIPRDRRTPIRQADIALKKGKVRDTRVSTCGDCYTGIFEHHDYLWTRRGYVHTECEDKKVEAEVNQGTLPVTEDIKS